MTTTLRLDATNPETLDNAIDRGGDLLLAENLVAFPTETVYGLGALAASEDAVRSVFVAKGRPSDNPLIVHVASADWIERLAITDRRVDNLAASLMPGPITVVLPARGGVSLLARAGLQTVAIRVPDHAVALRLIERTGPLVAPSANLSGRPSPTRADHVMHDLSGRIAAVIDGGSCCVGIESTVIDLSGRQAVILRPGTIAAERISEILGERVIEPGVDSDRQEIAPSSPGIAPSSPGIAPSSPGMKYRHYAPAAAIRLAHTGDLHNIPNDGRRRMLLIGDSVPELTVGVEVVLRLDEAGLYAAFRRADELGLDEIVIAIDPERMPRGLLDRVLRAAAH